MRFFTNDGPTDLLKTTLAVMMLASPFAANAITLNFEDSSLLSDPTTSHACSSDLPDDCGDPNSAMVFKNIGGTGIDLDVTADGSGSNWFVWHDLRPVEGGLGASNDETDPSSDNIFAGEEVTLTFSEQVILLSWDALNHGNGLSNATYSLIVDMTTEVSMAALTEGATNNLGFMGTAFTFLNTSSTGSGGLFYVSIVEFRNVSVPEPGTVAMLGLGLLGLGFRRRLANRT